jgi:hypothetical protein
VNGGVLDYLQRVRQTAGPRREETAVANSPYSIRSAEPERRQQTGEAENIFSAREAAWALLKHLEGPVEIIDHRDDPKGVVVGRLSFEWVE